MYVHWISTLLVYARLSMPRSRVVTVSIPCRTINKDIIKEDQDEFLNKWPENCIHKRLKHRRSIRYIAQMALQEIFNDHRVFKRPFSQCQ